ncbi:hypothetical protein HN011_010384 [Eciton burchellii]|nr:hypothetical protein HN011_010384 [Eciton burchellii]
MLLFVACLLPLVASLPLNEAADRYILDIDNSTLKNVRFASDSDRELDLSNMHIRELDKNAFDNVLDVESLLLSNNQLSSLPDFVFSNLTKLKNLSLDNNNIWKLETLLIGLNNLEQLNISGNPILHLHKGDLFSLTKSARIFTTNSSLWSISTNVFVDPLHEKIEQSTEDGQEIAAVMRHEEINVNQSSPIAIREAILHAKLCMSNGTVTSLDDSRKDGELVEGCTRMDILLPKGKVNLREHGIRDFQSGWYRLSWKELKVLDLSNNEIAEITEEMLNDLPATLRYALLANNKIRRVPSRVIKRDDPFELMLEDNPIEVIEEDAFADANLTALYLRSTQLNNLDFIASLPDTLTVLVVTESRVSSIPDNAFARLDKLLLLHLKDNHIGTLQNGVFRGLESLDTLILNRNVLGKIEPLVFDGLTSLRILDLQNNSIHDLRDIIFAGLTSLDNLLLSSNKIVQPTFGVHLPANLKTLDLMNNEIEALEQGDFVHAPTSSLYLNNNKISRISRGAFDLPTLKNLHLDNNRLTTIDGDSYEGLDRLRTLSLPENQISEITKGACKNMASVWTLDIARNPFRKLENGALHGLNKNSSVIFIYDNKLEEIQGGVFDDV